MATIVIFGASGDISRKKVIPGLHEWYTMDKKAIKSVIGYGRTKLSRDEFQEKLTFRFNDDNFSDLFDYQVGGYNEMEAFKSLKQKIIDTNTSDVIFYFGIPSYISPLAIAEISNTEINKSFNCMFILEKPIGTDLNSCNKILNEIYSYVDENDVYILDHYLGKTSIRNIINNKSDNIQQIAISLNEIDNVDHRLEYFNNVGIFKDMIQSHAMAILYYLVPYIFDIDNLDNMVINEIIKGQYKEYGGDISTDTYLKINLTCNGTNIILEAGKGLANDNKSIIINNKIVEITSDSSEYKSLFQDALNHDKSKYLDINKLTKFWMVSQYLWEHIEKAPMITYKQGSHPLFNDSKKQSNYLSI